VNRLLTIGAALTLAVVCAAPAFAQDPGVAAQLKGFGFGVALGFRINVYKPDIVTDASIDANGVVRVDTRSNATAGFVLESHYFFLRSKEDDYGNKTFGMGPFVAVQPGSDQIVTAIGVGWMAGWRRNNAGGAFTLGVGYASIPSAKVLGDEFVPGQAAPAGATAVRFQQRDKGSILAICGFTF